MNPIVLFAASVDREVDLVGLRQRARRASALLDYDIPDQTRIATAASEVAREASAVHGRAVVAFELDVGDDATLTIRLTMPAATIAPRGERGEGLARACRLMDDCADTETDGLRTIVLDKRLPRGKPRPDRAKLETIARTLADESTVDPISEVRAQNQELLRGLDEVREKQDALERLNAELENTNRGVVALYAELDVKSTELQELNRTLEERVAHAVAERERADERLRQSQKMEAVGQLTGGIAHDFNNLLQAITGNLEIVARNVPADAARVQRAVAQAMRAAKSAATLTQRLLAFSRRQALMPKPIDANQLIASMVDLLRRTLGETVEIQPRLASDLWVVEVDPTELENALINLAVNARDAMPDGGMLTIETRNVVQPLSDATLPGGRFVAIDVRDTGSGMPPDVVARVFEPFFTTKEVGKGTGLGLAMVYGFAKQSGGDVRVESTVGEGTTVTLLFPRCTTAATVDEPPPAAVDAAPGVGTILVVEDDAQVRAYSADALRELGYTVLEAVDGPSALALVGGDARIDLLFTDVVLSGGMTGPQLATRAIAARPSLRVLFTSGYSRNALESNGRLDPAVQMIGKPFTFADLAVRVREVLAARPARSPTDRIPRLPAASP